jgi:RHS repeat-associated protein
VLASQDSINGNWTYTYDDFNRLVSASASAGPLSGTSMTWTYDRFGNRWSQTGANAQSNTYTGHNNRIDRATYDAAGNLLVTNGNQYVYDDENRIVSMSLYLGGTASYAYDAEGQRVRKVAGTTVEEYVYDEGGSQIATMQPNGAMKRIELYIGARHLATYDIASNATYFIHGDWLGTERLRTNATGAAYESCTSLPFGDNQTCTGGADISPMHFTGKPRDTETNLDYFGARYYNSGMARWMSPDWAGKPTTVPYAQFGDPQSLNLYGYVTDNPVSRQDGDGHDAPAPPPGSEYVQLPGASNPVQAQQIALSMGLTNFTILGFDSNGTEQYNSAQQQAGIGPISGYSETGVNSWRASNDAVFTAGANEYDALNYLSPGDSLYVSQKQLKAQAMIESGGTRAAFESDPLQVNNRGDFTADKAQVTGLKLGQAMTPIISVEASLQWLQHKAEIHDANGNVTGYRSMHDALRNYNGNTRVYPNQGGLQHRDWYANHVISLSQ